MCSMDSHTIASKRATINSRLYTKGKTNVKEARFKIRAKMVPKEEPKPGNGMYEENHHIQQFAKQERTNKRKYKRRKIPKTTKTSFFAKRRFWMVRKK